jgi:rod shape-determining protein MreB
MLEKIQGMYNQIYDLAYQAIGIDLGTSNTLVYLKGKGIIIEEPSVVALDKQSMKILAIGNTAKEMVGRTPGNIIAIRPLRDGVITNFEIAERMIEHFLKLGKGQNLLLSSITQPKIVIGIPTNATEVQKRAVREAALSAGAKTALLIQESIAAAIGSGIDISSSTGNLIVDIGGGTTETAVIALGTIISGSSIRTAGYAMDLAIQDYLKQVYNVSIGEISAENIKIQYGTAWPLEDEIIFKVRGQDILSGLPKEIEISTVEIRDALNQPIEEIITGIKQIIEKTPSELITDVMRVGVTLAGGGALLKGIETRIANATNFPIKVSLESKRAVIKGISLIIEDREILKILESTMQLKKVSSKIDIN